MSLAVLIGAIGLAACSSTSDALRARFARERSCPAAEVSVTESGATAYHASGCGQSAEYVCGSFVTGGEDAARGCEERGLSRKARSTEEEPFRASSGTDPEPAPGRVRNVR